MCESGRCELATSEEAVSGQKAMETGSEMIRDGCDTITWQRQNISQVKVKNSQYSKYSMNMFYCIQNVRISAVGKTVLVCVQS